MKKEIILLGGGSTLALLAGCGEQSVPKSTASEPQVLPITQQVPGLPSFETSRGFEELLAFLSWPREDSAWQIDRSKVQIIITPKVGRVVAEEGLKVRLFPSTAVEAAPSQTWLRRGQRITYPYGLQIKKEDGTQESWGAFKNVRYQDEKGEVWQWLFFAVEIDGQKLVDTSEGELGTARPRTHSQISASFSGRELPTAQTRLSSSSTRLSDANRFPRTKSSFWAVRTSR